ncbi:MAG: YkgJ family cysteine cluster protein [Syntrophales bacterium]
MESRDLCEIVVLSKYDVIIPFICYQCGNCCRKYFPHIFKDQLPEISRILNKSLEEIETLLADHFDAYNSGAPKDCCFLDTKSNKCLIQEIKPESCRLFPVYSDFGSGNVDCRGYKELRNVTCLFLEKRKIAAVYKSCHYKLEMRNIPSTEWSKILSKLAKAEVSPLFVQRFLKANKIKVA